MKRTAKARSPRSRLSSSGRLLFLGIFLLLGAQLFGQAKPQPKELVIWSVARGPNTKGEEAQIHQFQQMHPEYHLRWLSMGAGGMNPQKLMTSIVGNVAPDVIFQDRFTVGDWASRNAFMPLDDFMKRDAADPDCPKESDYYPAVWKEASYKGHLYGIPWAADDRCLYYNKAIFKEKADQLRAAGLDPNRPPRTWSELLKYSKILTEFNPDGTLKRAGYFPNFGNSWLYLYSFQMNGSLLSPDGRTCTMDTPENVAALQFMVDGYQIFATKGHTGYENAKDFETGFLSYANDPFLIGKVAMKTDGDWILKDIAQYTPDLDFGVAPTPVPDDRYYHRGAFAHEKDTFVTWTGGYCYAIPKTARNPEGAWQFIKYTTSLRGRILRHTSQRDWERHRGHAYIPEMSASRAANQVIFDMFKPPDPKFAAALQTHIDMLKSARVRPSTALAQLLWDQQVQATEDACFLKNPPATSLLNAQKAVQLELDDLYHEDSYPLVNWSVPIWISAVIVLALAIWGLIAYRRRRLRPLARNEARWAFLFVSPWAFGFIVFTVGPMIVSLIWSFTRYTVLTPARWVGAENYVAMVTTNHDRTFKAFSNVLYLAGVGVPLSVATGLAVALLLNAAVRGMRVYRTMFYMPAIVPTIASAVLWIWLLYGDPHRGLINGFWDATITKWLGLSPPGWLNAEPWSKPALILMGVWGAGSGMILWLAGLKGVPASLYEASCIDGATPRQQFWAVTIPQLSPIMFFNVVMGFIGALQEFDRVYVMRPVEGAMGPGESLLTPVYLLFQNGFAYFKMGYASALAWTIFAIIVVITLIQFRLSRSWVHYEAGEE